MLIAAPAVVAAAELEREPRRRAEPCLASPRLAEPMTLVERDRARVRDDAVSDAHPPLRARVTTSATSAPPSPWRIHSGATNSPSSSTASPRAMTAENPIGMSCSSVTTRTLPERTCSTGTSMTSGWAVSASRYALPDERRAPLHLDQRWDVVEPRGAQADGVGIGHGRLTVRQTWISRPRNVTGTRHPPGRYSHAVGRARLLVVLSIAVLAALAAIPAVAPAASFTWDLTHDFTTASPGANPDKDSYGGHPWSYEEGGRSRLTRSRRHQRRPQPGGGRRAAPRTLPSTLRRHHLEWVGELSRRQAVLQPTATASRRSSPGPPRCQAASA